MSEERKMILKMVQEGRMSVDEADKLLSALEKASTPASEPSAESAPKSSGPKMDQVFGTVSSFLENVTQQWAPSLEKKVSQLFQGSRSTGTTHTDNRTQDDLQITPSEQVQTIEVFNPYGEIKVTSSPDQHIHLTLEKLADHPSVEEAQRLFQLCQVKHEENGSLFRVYLEEQDALKKARVNAHLKLQLPKHKHLKLASIQDDLHLEQWSEPQHRCQLRTTKGDIYCQQVVCLDAQLDTTNGNIYSDLRSQHLQVHSHSGDVKSFGQYQTAKFQTQSGQIQFQGQASESLHAETTSGDVSVKLHQVCPLVTLTANSGDVLLEGCVGTVKLNSASGDIEGILTFKEPAGLECKSNSGDIAIALPELPVEGFRIDATSQSGDIECRLELTETKTGEHDLKGQWGAAQTLLQLNTNSGDILVSR